MGAEEIEVKHAPCSSRGLEFGSQHPAGLNSSSTPDLILPPSFLSQSPERQNLIGPASVSYYLLVQSTVTRKSRSCQPQESSVRDRDLSRRFLKKVPNPL